MFSKSFTGNVVVFIAEGQRTALILGIFYCDRAYPVPILHIYTECGDWDVYFCIGFTTTSRKVNGISLTLSFILTVNFFGAERIRIQL